MTVFCFTNESRAHVLPVCLLAGRVMLRTSRWRRVCAGAPQTDLWVANNDCADLARARCGVAAACCRCAHALRRRFCSGFSKRRWMGSRVQSVCTFLHPLFMEAPLSASGRAGCPVDTERGATSNGDGSPQGVRFPWPMAVGLNTKLKKVQVAVDKRTAAGTQGFGNKTPIKQKQTCKPSLLCSWTHKWH